MPKGRPLRRPNGMGTIVMLSGRRRKPYEVRVNTHMDERNYPIYDILGRFENRFQAEIALAKYDESPYNLLNNTITFYEVYEKWYDRKFSKNNKKFSESTMRCVKSALAKCKSLYNVKFKDIKTSHMQNIVDNYNLSHAMMEHLLYLFKQLFIYALEFDIVQKNYATFVMITKDDDDEPGDPFTKEEINLLWANKDKPYVDSILIFIYSGWRVSELLSMPRESINIKFKTFQGGMKTKAGKNRIVPIHSKIYRFVQENMNGGYPVLFGKKGKAIDKDYKYRTVFINALKSAGIQKKHTPHDCRHTFATLLNNAGANPVCVKRLMGHSSGADVTEKVYTHKDIEQLRKAIELI